MTKIYYFGVDVLTMSDPLIIVVTLASRSFDAFSGARPIHMQFLQGAGLSAYSRCWKRLLYFRRHVLGNDDVLRQFFNCRILL